MTAHICRLQVLWIEFYNSWCGHCIRFAPTWKELAKDIADWHPVVELAVVDCAEDRNTELCREYEIYLYPSCRFFWLNWKPLRDYTQKGDGKNDNWGDTSATKSPDKVGLLYEGELSEIKFLRKGLLDYIEKSWPKGVGTQWPHLMPLNVQTKEQFFDELPVSKKLPLMVVIEKTDSYVGREVILDLSAYQHKVIVQRMHDSNKDLLQQLLPQPVETYKLPLLLEVNPTSRSIDVVCCTNGEDNSEASARKTFSKLIKTKYAPEALTTPKPTDAPQALAKPLINHKAQSGALPPVHMDDLNNAVRYALMNQVLRLNRFNSTAVSSTAFGLIVAFILARPQLETLKSWLEVVDAYFPFDDEKFGSFFKLLTRWSSTQNHYLSANELISTIRTFERDFPMPKMNSYRSCAGSDPKYRGFPCSLWTLFHTLTVQEYTHPKLEPHRVLRVMKQFIINFFGCTECANNFRKEAGNLEDELRQLKHANASVIWLWRTHNQVNKRLHGDASEDPEHPKVQFPPASACPQCYFTNGSFNEPAVVEFLVKRHSAANIVKSTREETKAVVSNPYEHDHVHVHGFNSFSSSKVASVYSLLNRTDISLALILYVLSAGLIVSLFFIMRLRGRRKVPHYYNRLHNKHYP